jgi:competence protein ComEC
MPHAGFPATNSSLERISSREVKLAARSWIQALALRPLLFFLPFVVLGCVLGRAWAETIRSTSPGDAILFAPTLLAVLGVALRFKYLRAQRSPNWGALGATGLCVLGLVATHAARRWTPASDDISRVLASHEDRLRPLEPLSGRVVARVVELKRGENSDFAVLELAPAPATSASLREARGRVWAKIARTSQAAAQVLALHSGNWILARVELRETRAPGSAAEADERTFAQLRGCWCEGDIQSIEAIAPPRLGWAAGDWSGAVEAARSRIAARFESGFARLGVPFSEQSAQVATAMAFGEGGLREPLPNALRQAFKRAGVSHVLVASGAQVALVCLLLWSVARLLCAPLRSLAWRNAVMALSIVPAILFYALLVGGAASIWRAALVGLGALWVQAQGRKLDALSLWCGALSLLLVCDPAALYDLSLQLSFGAAWGLIAFSAPLQRAFLAPLRALEPERAMRDLDDYTPTTSTARLREAAASVLSWQGARHALWLCARGLSGVAAVSLAAHIGTLPVLLHAFGSLSVASLCANLPIVPLSAVLVTSGSASLLAPIRPLDTFNYALADGVVRLVGVAASWRSSWIEAPALSLGWTALLCAVGIFAAGAVAWPRLLFAQVPSSDDASEDEEPRAPSPHEVSLLWHASARCIREALRKSVREAAP